MPGSQRSDCPAIDRERPDQSQSARTGLFAQIQDVELERAHLQAAPAAFLRAYKSAASLAGARFFGTGTLADLKIATSIHDLQPNLQKISDAIGVLSPGEKVFLAALVSFADAAHGGRLLQRAGVQGLADLGRLDFTRRTLIAALILNFTTW